MDAFPEFLFLGKIIAAAFLGGLVGMEREFAEKPAGLRTHMLVCATSAFLGAGTILKHNRERTVEGLTTSASILSVSAIGIAVALNAFILAIGVTVLNVIIKWGVSYVAERTKTITKE